jgi:hypothetical protein
LQEGIFLLTAPRYYQLQYSLGKLTIVNVGTSF